MQIDVLRELRQSIGAVSVVDFEEDDVSADDLDLRGFSGSVSMLRTDRGLLVTLNAEARAQESCSRCLKNVDVPIEIAFEEEYVPEIDANTGAAVRDATAPDTFRIGPDFILDLREGVRQYILMSEPAKPLCRADCRGLCPSCGADLNEGACKCATERDSRWEALAGLKKETEGS
jgi:uncharacterized protein